MSPEKIRPVRDVAVARRFVAGHPRWTIAPEKIPHEAQRDPQHEAEDEGLNRTYAFTEYGAALAFAVRIGVAAEKRDHHPELHISWGQVTVRWSTHDAGGITALDVEMAEVSDAAYGPEA